MMRSILFILACAALVSTRASAQGMISGAKAVAGRAAAATNAHTQAVQSPTATPAPTAKSTPVSAAPSASAASAKTTPVATTTAAKTTPVAAAKTTPVAAAKTAPVATTKAVVTTAKAAPVAKPAVAPAVTSDTGARSISVTQRGMKGEVSLEREVFSYDAGGRRDPFVSLLRNGDLRPMLNDLRLVAVLYDPTGRNSVAVMHDLTTKDQYQVKVGQTLGRMRVSGIEPKEVLFTIEEIGFSRQVGLALGDSSRARTQ